jgi:hypothetical protein
MCAMHEVEKDAFKIDIAAAGINVQAAEIAQLAGERKRGAERRLQFSHFDKAVGHDDAESEHRRVIELATAVAQDAAVIRDASQRIQTNAQALAATKDPLFG